MNYREREEDLFDRWKSRAKALGHDSSLLNVHPEFPYRKS